MAAVARMRGASSGDKFHDKNQARALKNIFSFQFLGF
jgi:hypothetical protein